MSALDREIARIGAAARRQAVLSVKDGARRILASDDVRATCIGLLGLPDASFETIARYRRSEYRRGIERHWTYSRDRHVALSQLLLAARVLRRRERASTSIAA